jgi:hypothetical protein
MHGPNGRLRTESLTMSLCRLASPVKVGLAFWLLLSPGENWTWVIVGGHEQQQDCEQARNERLDGDHLLCAATLPWTAEPRATDMPGDPGQMEQGPSPGLATRRNLGSREEPTPGLGARDLPLQSHRDSRM